MLEKAKISIRHIEFTGAGDYVRLQCRILFWRLPSATVTVNILPLAIDLLQDGRPLGKILIGRSLVHKGTLLEKGDDGHVATGQKAHAGKLNNLLLGDDDVLADHHVLHDGRSGRIAAGTDPDRFVVNAERFVHGVDLLWILVGEGLEPSLSELCQVFLDLGFVIAGSRRHDAEMCWCVINTLKAPCSIINIMAKRMRKLLQVSSRQERSKI